MWLYILHIPGPDLAGDLRPAEEAAHPAPLPGAGPGVPLAEGEIHPPQAQTAPDKSSIKKHSVSCILFTYKAEI